MRITKNPFPVLTLLYPVLWPGCRKGPKQCRERGVMNLILFDDWMHNLWLLLLSQYNSDCNQISNDIPYPVDGVYGWPGCFLLNKYTTACVTMEIAFSMNGKVLTLNVRRHLRLQLWCFEQSNEIFLKCTLSGNGICIEGKFDEFHKCVLYILI